MTGQTITHHKIEVWTKDGQHGAGYSNDQLLEVHGHIAVLRDNDGMQTFETPTNNIARYEITAIFGVVETDLEG